MFLWFSNEGQSTPRTGQPEGPQQCRKRNWFNCITLVSKAKQLSSEAISTEDERRRKIVGHSLILILKILQSKRFPPTNLHLPSPQTLRHFSLGTNFPEQSTGSETQQVFKRHFSGKESWMNTEKNIQKKWFGITLFAREKDTEKRKERWN